MYDSYTHFVFFVVFNPSLVLVLNDVLIAQE